MNNNFMSSNENKYNTKNPFKKLLLNIFLNDIKIIINKINFNSILDFGCGEGYMLKFLSKNIDLNNKYILGIDYSSNAIEKAKNINNNGNFIVGNEKYLNNVENNSFDLVCCFEVLEHLSNPNIVLNILNNISKKYLIISVPNEPMFTFLRFLSFNNFFQFGKHPEHVNFWNRQTFYDFIAKNINSNKISIKISNTWLIAIIEK